MEQIFRHWDIESTGDAERDAIGVIPKVLHDLSSERSIEVLKYLIKRYESGDTFGLKWR